MQLSSAQKQIYNMEKVVGESVGVICGYVLTQKKYDIKDMIKAINEIYRINDALRIKVVSSSKEPYQYICEYTEKDVDVLFFDSRDALHKFTSIEAESPLNFNKTLCEIKAISSNDFCGIFYKVHHIISDGWSLAHVTNQFFKILEKESVEAFSYVDYLDEEQKYLQSKRAKKDMSYFVEKYNRCSEPTFLFDTPPSAHKSKRKRFVVNESLSDKIKNFVKSNDVSPYTLFFTIISLFFSKQKNNVEKFYIGTAIVNRTTHVQQNTVGMFVNTVPFLVELTSNENFYSNLIKMQDNLFGLFRHQRLNYVDFLPSINGEKLFDVIFNYQNNTLSGKDFESKWYHNGFLTNSLEIHVDDRDNKGNFRINYDYQTDKFTENDIDIFHQRLMTLLNNAIDNPEKALYELECLTKKDKAVLNTFNATVVNYPREKCVHKLFEEQAEKNPNKIAVVACDKVLTYRQLNEDANKIAYSLIEKGIKKGDIVAFNLPRRSYLIATMLGILKAGAAYLPMDPDYPKDRKDYILSDSKAKWLITDDNVNDWLKDDKITNPQLDVSSENICYCIYTSGSTGQPKGVAISHRNVMNFCDDNPFNNAQHYIAQNCNVVLACGSITFDISNFEIILSLALDKTIVFASERELTNTNLLADLIKNNQIDCIPCTPTKLYTYLENSNFANAFKWVKCAMLAGERLDAKVCNTINKYSKAKIFNGYGPTETTMGVSFGEVDKYGITLGKPIANTQIYIVDRYLSLMPIGVVGELCVAGDGVGLGYLNRPELTAEKFIDNPFGEGKLYKTGDLAYWREDGNICYVGRNDFQVKIRGLRIELGEIESTLQAIDGVEHAVVVVRRDTEERQLICAFYTGKETDAKELRSLLSTKLPKYMIPHIFTHLDQMPMTTSGKANRNALPEIELKNISAEIEYVAPNTQKEKALADVVSSVLRTKSVNMLDNFFNIGGDSITAIYIVSELEEMGYEIHVADIMQSDTLSDVAKAMKSISNKAIYEQDEVNGFVPFSPIMRAYLNDNNTISKDFVHTCIVSADCDEDMARKALDVLISHHDILRGTFVDNGIKVYPSNEREVYSFKAITIDNTDEAKEYLSNLRFDDDKLVNVVFCKTERESLLSITIHHFLIDLVSWDVLMKDFKTVVKQLKSNEEISLPAKTASFKMWSDELRKYSEIISEENKAYWKNVNDQLDNTKSLYLLEKSENEAEEFNFTFDKNISDKLIDEVNNTYSTRTNEVLLAALGLAAAKIADGSVGIIVESHGRTELHEQIAIERTVGWFTSCYPVIISNNRSVTEELINTKETMRRIPKNGIDYLLLSPSFHKNTDIIFNFYNNSFADENRENELVAFISNTSVFPDKINVNCFIIDNILTLNISVPKCKHKPLISEELGMEFLKQIEKIIDICTTTDTVIKTRSDFSDEELTESELDELKDLFDWIDDDE